MKKTKIQGKALAAGLLAAGLCGTQTSQAQWTYTGDYLKVGVGSGGSIIDPNTFTGIQYSATGFPAINNDIITPGTPYQFFSVGVNGSYGVSSYNDGNSLGGSAVNTSSGGNFSTLTTGNYGGVSFSQTLSLAKNSTVISFGMTLKNNTGSTIPNVAFASGFDPDPDVYQYGSYFTLNNILSKSVVQASGPDTGNTILIQALTGGDVPSIVQGWPYDNPYGLLSGSFSGTSVVGANDNGDYDISEAWAVGDLAPGQTETIDYNYIINATPVTTNSPVLGTAPDMGSTFGMLGFALAGLNCCKRFIARKRN
jgi:hypothetical protein